MTSPLLKILQHQIVPLSEQFGMSKIAVAAPSWPALQAQMNTISLPDGMTASSKPLLSKRTPIKGRRQYGNAALVDAYWPRDHLESCRAPYLAYCLSGAVAFPLAGYVLHCQPGHGILVPPGVAHSDGTHLFLDESVSDNVACKMLKIRPYNGGIECWLSHTRNGEHYSHRAADETCRISLNQAVLYFESLTEEVQSRKSRYQKICDALLIALFNLLLRELQSSPVNYPALSSMPLVSLSAQVSHNPITQAEEFIHNHLGESLTLRKIARYVYMSERSFTDAFRQKTGQSFLEYLTEYRFKEAWNLLQNTDWSIEIISGFVGVKSGRLRALFQQRLGISPGSFRDQNKKAG